MKKLLLSSVAICGLAVAATPAMADEGMQYAGGLKLDVGGWYKGYLAYVDQDEATGANDARNFDWLQSTEIHFGGETTLDNGLTVGVHVEAEADNSDSFEVEESYAYFSGAWGRVNAGAENGAVYLLQVDAPSADSNVDGIRQYIQPVNYDLTGFSGISDTVTAGTNFDFDGNGLATGDTVIAPNASIFGDSLFVFDYDDDVSAYANKITYLTPVWEGFQAGVSFTPELDEDEKELSGVHSDDDAGEFGNTYEIALRYAGEFSGVGVAVGAGFTHANLEDDLVIAFEDTNGNGVQNAGEATLGRMDDRQSWNAGIDLDFSAFGVGVAYVQDDQGLDGDGDQDTLVVGIDYTTGPWKLGASYYNQDQELDFIGADDIDTDRYTGGVVYTYGPGMTFRGSISYIEHDSSSFEDTDATSVLLGTQINF